MKVNVAFDIEMTLQFDLHLHLIDSTHLIDTQFGIILLGIEVDMTLQICRDNGVTFNIEKVSSNESTASLL